MVAAEDDRIGTVGVSNRRVTPSSHRPSVLSSSGQLLLLFRPSGGKDTGRYLPMPSSASASKENWPKRSTKDERQIVFALPAPAAKRCASRTRSAEKDRKGGKEARIARDERRDNRCGKRTMHVFSRRLSKKNDRMVS